jgi:hypothetical protein
MAAVLLVGAAAFSALLVASEYDWRAVVVASTLVLVCCFIAAAAFFVAFAVGFLSGRHVNLTCRPWYEQPW